MGREARVSLVQAAMQALKSQLCPAPTLLPWEPRTRVDLPSSGPSLLLQTPSPQPGHLEARPPQKHQSLEKTHHLSSHQPQRTCPRLVPSQPVTTVAPPSLFGSV